MIGNSPRQLSWRCTEQKPLHWRPWRSHIEKSTIDIDAFDSALDNFSSWPGRGTNDTRTGARLHRFLNADGVNITGIAKARIKSDSIPCLQVIDAVIEPVIDNSGAVYIIA